MSKTDELIEAIDECAREFKTERKPDKFFPRIVSPGKFESEPTWVPYFWGLAMNGCSDREDHDGDTLLSCFAVDQAMATLGIGTLGMFVCLWESEQGFVNWQLLDGYALDALGSDCDSE